MTVAVVEAVYSLATPGVNGAERGRSAQRQASVAGTVPPTGPRADRAASAQPL